MCLHEVLIGLPASQKQVEQAASIAITPIPEVRLFPASMYSCANLP